MRHRRPKWLKVASGLDSVAKWEIHVHKLKYPPSLFEESEYMIGQKILQAISDQQQSCRVVVKIDENEFHAGQSKLEGENLHQWNQKSQHCIKKAILTDQNTEKIEKEDIVKDDELLFNPPEPIHDTRKNYQFEMHEKPHGIVNVISLLKGEYDLKSCPPN